MTHLMKLQRTLFLACLWCMSLCLAYAGPDNIALKAKVTASSSLSTDCEPFNAIDGSIRILNKNEWVSNSQMTYWGFIEYPWIQLE